MRRGGQSLLVIFYDNARKKNRNLPRPKARVSGDAADEYGLSGRTTKTFDGNCHETAGIRADDDKSEQRIRQLRMPGSNIPSDKFKKLRTLQTRTIGKTVTLNFGSKNHRDRRKFNLLIFGFENRIVRLLLLRLGYMDEPIGL